MATYFFDSSALVKRYVTEIGTDWINSLSQFSHDFIGDYRIVEVSPALLQSAMILAERHTLRAYDAVQLAAAVELHRRREAGRQPASIFVSGDRDLNRAGTAEGLVVDDPHDHS